MEYEEFSSTFTMDDGHCLCPKCSGSTLVAKRFRISGEGLADDQQDKIRHMVPSCDTCGFTPGYLSFLNAANRRANNLSALWDMFIISIPQHQLPIKIGVTATAKSAKVAQVISNEDYATMIKAVSRKFDANAPVYGIETLSPVMLASLQHHIFKEPSFFGDFVRTCSAPRVWVVANSVAINGLRASELGEIYDSMRNSWVARGNANLLLIHHEFTEHLLAEGFTNESATLADKFIGVVSEAEVKQTLLNFAEFRPNIRHPFVTK